MNTLPNAHLVVIPIEKLRDYSLNPENPEGKGKARVFTAALGIHRQDSKWLHDTVLENASKFPCRPGPPSRYGAKYVLDMVLSRGEKSVLVSTAWLVPVGQDAPRLISIYVLPSKAWEPRT